MAHTKFVFDLSSQNEVYSKYGVGFWLKIDGKRIDYRTEHPGMRICPPERTKNLFVAKMWIN